MIDAEMRRKATRRLLHELREYTFVVIYLFVCLGAFLFYKSALLQAEGISFTPFGIAALKALILGKFMMVGHALKIGEHYDGRPLIQPILHKTAVFVGLLFVLDVGEEIIVGAIHGRTLAETMTGFAGGTWQQAVAVCVLFFLILLPYFAYREVGQLLGEDRLRRIMLSGRPATPT
jgi:hypothetical protein